MLPTNERGIAILAIACVASYAMATKRSVLEGRLHQMKEDGGSPQRVPSAERIQDTPLASWIITNASVIGVVYLKTRVVGEISLDDSDLKNFVKLVLGSMLTVEPIMGINWILINKIYAHIPFFSGKRKVQTNLEIFQDYLSCNFVVSVLVALFQAKLFRILRNAASSKHVDHSFHPLRFMFRLLYVRLFVDVGFFLGHYIMHLKQYYWVHKKHHEHNKTQLTTNYHFHWFDLMIEAFIPAFAGVASYEFVFSTAIRETEVNLLMMYIFWFEVQSHAGKALPTMSLLPPVAPLMQSFDDWNCWFHEIHHNVLKCNYSIAPWFDTIMGTARWNSFKEKTA